mgnify:CR=1 FL=1
MKCSKLFAAVAGSMMLAGFSTGALAIDNKDIKIGVSIWSSTDVLGSQCKAILDEAAKALGVQVQYVDQAHVSERVTASVEQLVAAGCQGIIICNSLSDEIMKKLRQGAKVLYMPDSTSFGKSKYDVTDTKTVGGLFQTDYWNYGMFKSISENNKRPVSPGTLGLLMNPDHPLFNDFPTDSHTNWQWFPIIKASHPLILDKTDKNYRPIVQVIDNIERNHKLGLIFEYAVEKGKLLVCMSPLNKLEQYSETRQLYKSILNYMQSSAFQPETRIVDGL